MCGSHMMPQNRLSCTCKTRTSRAMNAVKNNADKETNLLRPQLDNESNSTNVKRKAGPRKQDVAMLRSNRTAMKMPFASKLCNPMRIHAFSVAGRRR